MPEMLHSSRSALRMAVEVRDAAGAGHAPRAGTVRLWFARAMVDRAAPRRLLDVPDERSGPCPMALVPISLW